MQHRTLAIVESLREAIRKPLADEGYALNVPLNGTGDSQDGIARWAGHWMLSDEELAAVLEKIGVDSEQMTGGTVPAADLVWWNSEEYTFDEGCSILGLVRVNVSDEGI